MAKPVLPASPKLELATQAPPMLDQDPNGVRMQSVALIEPAGRDVYVLASDFSRIGSLGSINTTPRAR